MPKNNGNRTTRPDLDNDDDDDDAEVIYSPSPCRPDMSLKPDTLAEATSKIIGQAKKARNEPREYAARALLSCLRVGDADAVADALVEHFISIGDED